jgi:hypothetical protein
MSVGLAQLSVQSTQTVTHLLMMQLKAINLQTRHRHLLHLFEVANSDVKAVDVNTRSSGEYHQLVNERTSIQEELDKVVIQLTELTINCGLQIEADLAALQNLQMELLRA